MASYKLEVHQDWSDGQKLDFVQYVCKDVGNQFIDRYVEGIEKARVENGYPYGKYDYEVYRLYDTKGRLVREVEYNWKQTL